MVSVIRKIVARYEADVSAFERGIADAGRKHDDFTKKVVKGTEEVKGAQDRAGRASGALGEAVRKTGTNFDGVVPKLGRARDEMGRYIGGARGAEEATTVLGKSVTVLGQNFTGTFPGMVRHVGDVVAASGRLKLALGGAVTVATGLLATSFVQLADQSKAVDNQLRGIGAASDEMRAKVYALAVETRTPLESTIGLLRSMQKSLSTQTLDQTLRQVGTLNRLLTVGGLDANARGSVALQFGQALQSGILQGDELRSLRESAPFELMDAIAKRAGGTVETLKDLGTQGKLTRDVMVGALEDLESVSREKFGAFEMTVSEAMVVFNTALVGAAGEIDNAIGATDFFASALAGMAGLLRDHSGALAALAQALGAVAQLALMAAGARGLAALLGPLGAAGAALPGVIASFRAYAAAMGSVQAAALATAVAQQSLMRGLSSVTAMMGGPLGVAIFAAVGAMTVMARLTTTVAEDLDAAAESMESYRATATKLATAQGEIDTDRARLVELNKKITESIDAQGSAAEAVAGREAAAINARIAKNQELLHVYHALAAEELARSRSRMEQAERELRSQAALAQGNIVSGALSYFGNEDITREYANDLSNRAASGERLAPQELEFLQLFARIEEQREKQRQAEIEWAEAAPGMANAHIRAWKAAQKAATDAADLESKAVEALNKKYDERAAKLAELQKQLAAAQQQVATLPAGDERNAAVRAVGEAERQIRELRDVEERVASVKDGVDRMNAAMAQSAGMFDPNGVIRNLIKEIEAELRRAELAGEDLDEVRLTQLETALAGLVSKAKELGIELRTAASTDFDQLAERMRTGPLPYAQDVANARSPDYKAAGYNEQRLAGTDDRNAELVREAVRAATELGISVEDLLSVIMLESGGDPTIRGGAGNRHVGLIQFGPWEQGHYGVTQQTPIPQQMDAIIRYMRDRGVKPGMPIENVYAAVNAGQAHLTNRGDTANGGIVQNIKDFTTGAAMEPFRADAQGLLRAYAPEVADYEKQFKDEIADRKTAADQAARDEEARKKRQDDYLASLKDENELLALKASLNGKSSVEQDYQIRVHQALSEATAAGIDLESRYLDTQLTMRDAIIRKVQDEMQAEAELNATREVERLKQIEHEKELQKERERVAERAAFHRQVEQDIQGIIVGSIMKTGDWREMAGRLIEQLAQAYLYAGLFNSGPLARKDGGSGLMGWLSSGLTNWLTGGATTSANGNIMTDAGPVQLNRYAYGGIARSPQLSIFGEGRQPEAYVPLPDGRTIPVTIKTPEVPSLAGVAAPQTMKLQLDLNNEMLEARIVDGSTPVAVEVTRQGIGQFSQNELPGRVRQSNQDPKRVRS